MNPGEILNMAQISWVMQQASQPQPSFLHPINKSLQFPGSNGSLIFTETHIQTIRYLIENDQTLTDLAHSFNFNFAEDLLTHPTTLKALLVATLNLNATTTNEYSRLANEAQGIAEDSCNKVVNLTNQLNEQHSQNLRLNSEICQLREVLNDQLNQIHALTRKTHCVEAALVESSRTIKQQQLMISKLQKELEIAKQQAKHEETRAAIYQEQLESLS